MYLRNNTFISILDAPVENEMYGQHNMDYSSKEDASGTSNDGKLV